MERNRFAPPPHVPPPTGRSRPAGGHFSFERSSPQPPAHPSFAPHQALIRQEFRGITPPEAPFNVEAIQPRELFDPQMNEAHRKWLKDRLKEVREASFGMAALYGATAIMTWALGAYSTMEGILEHDDMMRNFAVLPLVIATMISSFAGRELRNADDKRKMGLSNHSE